MSNNFQRDPPLALDFSTPTFLKNDLRLLNEKIVSASTSVHSQNYKPSASEGKEGDIVNVVGTGTCEVFKKSTFPSLLLFPDFPGTIRTATTANELSSAISASLSGDVVEILNDITLTQPIALPTVNFLIRSRSGYKYTLSFSESAITPQNAIFYHSTSTIGCGLCVQNIIFRQTDGASSKAIFELIMGGNLTNDLIFQNCDFYFGKICFNLQCPLKNVQLQNCNFYNISSASEMRAFAIYGIRNLYVKNCNLFSTGAGAFTFIQYLDHSDNTTKKVTGDIFLDEVIDRSNLPDTMRHCLVFEDPSNMILTRKVSVYVKDCFLKSSSASHIAIIGTGASPATPVFQNFQDIILLRNTYQNNHGKGLFHWDATTVGGSNYRNGLVGGQEYSFSNTAIQNNYFRADATNSAVRSLLTGTASALGENQHWSYNLRGGSGSVQFVVPDSWEQSARWVQQIQPSFALNPLVVSSSFSSPQSTFTLTGLDFNAAPNGWTVYVDLRLASSGSTTQSVWVYMDFNNTGTASANFISTLIGMADFGSQYAVGSRIATCAIGAQLWRNDINNYQGTLIIRRTNSLVNVRTLGTSFGETDGGSTFNTSHTWNASGSNITSITFSAFKFTSTNSLSSSLQSTGQTNLGLLSGSCRIVRNT